MTSSLLPKVEMEPNPDETPQLKDPKQKPEIEPEHLPEEEPGILPGTHPGEDEEVDEPNTEPEIGDDPDTIEKKTPMM